MSICHDSAILTDSFVDSRHDVLIDSCQNVLTSPSTMEAPTKAKASERVQCGRFLRPKVKCVPEYRRELLKFDDVIVEAGYGDNYWSCGLKTHEVPWANEKRLAWKKHHGAATYGAARRITTSVKL